MALTPRTVKPQRSRLDIICDMFIVDVILYFATVGFYPKYRERLPFLESLDPAHDAEGYTAYSEPPTFSGLPYRLSSERPYTLERVPTPAPVRTLQADEWNKISTAISVVAATSAAALSILDISGVKAHWMVNILYCSALGVSLEGLILTFYLVITLGGASDELIGRMARGEWKILGIRVPRLLPTIGLTCPVLYTTYSAGFLLAGTVVMVLLSPKAVREEGQSFPDKDAYYYLPLIPIVYGYMCMAGVIAVTELGLRGAYYSRVGTHAERKQKRRERLRDPSPNGRK